MKNSAQVKKTENLKCVISTNKSGGTRIYKSKTGQIWKEVLNLRMKVVDIQEATSIMWDRLNTDGFFKGKGLNLNQGMEVAKNYFLAL